MKYLLDTGVFLWSLDAYEKLNANAQKILSSGQEELYLSAASAWEIVIKFGLGKLKLPEPPPRLIPKSMGSSGIKALPIIHTHTFALSELPSLHQDPFDRLLVAQAHSERMTLMTADPLCAKYPVEIFWCGK